VTIPRQHLGGGVGDGQPEAPADVLLDLGWDRRVGSHRSADLAHRNLGRRGGQAGPAAPHLVVVIGELDPEAERLGVNPVGPARHHGEPVPHRLGGERRLEAGRVVVNLAGRVSELGGQSRVDHVGGGEPQVEEAPLVADGLLDRLDERGDVMALLGLELGDASCIHMGAGPEPLRRLRGIRPMAAQPSAARSSTSSHRRSRDSSLKRAAIAAGV